MLHIHDKGNFILVKDNYDVSLAKISAVEHAIHYNYNSVQEKSHRLIHMF